MSSLDLNVSLAQLDHLDWYLSDVEIETTQPVIHDYYITGRSVYSADDPHISVNLYWKVKINDIQSVSDKKHPLAEYDFSFQCLNSELNGFDGLSIEQEDLEKWRDELVKSISWKFGVFCILPELISQEMNCSNSYTIDRHDPYEDDVEGYSSGAMCDSSRITTTYSGWMTMFQIALIYGWEPQDGSYYGGSGRCVSTLDAWAIHIALEKYIANPAEAYKRWKLFVANPKNKHKHKFPMGDKRWDSKNKTASEVSLSDPKVKVHWKLIGCGGSHLSFARRFSRYCAQGEFYIYR